VFKIKATYSIEEGAFEFYEFVFNDLYRKGSQLAPGYKFKKNECKSTISDITPILSNSEKIQRGFIKKFLKSNKVSEYILNIRNHPLPNSILVNLNNLLSLTKPQKR
jgi:hypothetical protein